MTADRSQALDHIVVVMFENRSFDNVLGHLYGPDDGKTFEGVIGKDLSNPIPNMSSKRCAASSAASSRSWRPRVPAPVSRDQWSQASG